jgi:hypothetical protein
MSPKQDVDDGIAVDSRLNLVLRYLWYCLPASRGREFQHPKEIQRIDETEITDDQSEHQM